MKPVATTYRYKGVRRPCLCYGIHGLCAEIKIYADVMLVNVRTLRPDPREIRKAQVNLRKEK